MLTGPFPAFLAFGLCASALRVGLPARRAERRQADATLPCTCPLDKFNSTGTLIAWAPVCLTSIPFVISVTDLRAAIQLCLPIRHLHVAANRRNREQHELGLPCFRRVRGLRVRVPDRPDRRVGYLSEPIHTVHRSYSSLAFGILLC
jgi:hypothetical protein